MLKQSPEYTFAIFLDLKKAFDTCDHQILIEKMKYYGFRGVSNKWFESYLSNRTQFVNIGTENSDRKNLLCGVPQGSVLGPLLFLIYINDLPRSTNFFTSLFADDTMFLKSSKNLDTLVADVNIELEKASNWFKANRLSLNVKKTKYMIFKNKNMKLEEHICKLYIDNSLLERIGNNCEEKFYKFVGIRIDENLTWEHHINHVCRKISSAIFALNQVKRIVPFDIKKLIYDTLIKSYLEYGILSWGNAKGTKLKKIINLQKKAVRIISDKQHKAHSQPLFASLNILRFDDLQNMKLNEFMYKHFHSKLPNSLHSLFVPLSVNNRSASYKIDRPKNECVNNFPSITFPRNWNKIDINLKKLESFTSFRKKLCMNYRLKYLEFRCTSNDCYSCTK